MRVSLLTRRGGGIADDVLEALKASAEAAGATLHAHQTDPNAEALAAVGIPADDGASSAFDLCLVLGGDGSILGAMREFAGTDVPVFAVNYGEVGFLATMEPEDPRAAFDRAFAGDFETMAMPSISLATEDDVWRAFNDISVHRQPGGRVADLAYALGGEEIGRVRCDGLVASTPAGSTGYNLANGGPVLAWGVEGFVVSFVAPHSFTARALVVAPGDALTISNASAEDDAEVHVDGRPARKLRAQGSITLRFGQTHAHLAQLPGASFYSRLRQVFGRLAR
jgi:NAD+ kinase